MNELLNNVKNITGENAWVFQVFIVVFAVLLFNYLLRIFLNRLHRKLRETNTPWDDAFIDALRKPLNLLVWVVGIAFAADIVGAQTGAVIFGAVGPIRDVAAIAVIAWFLVRLINGIEVNILETAKAAGKEVDRTTADAISRLLRISIIITAGLVVMQTLGFSISGVLAFGGIGGIAIGFAAKDLLANFFGAIMIFLDRPFSVGDWIRSPDRDIEGTVEHIGWRLTRIRTFSKRPLFVPNSVFANIALENPSRMSHRRIYETIGVRYEDAGRIGAIVEDVKQMLLEHSDIDQSQTLMVNFNSFGPSSMDFFVYTFTRTTIWTEYHEVKHAILLLINDIITSHGAEIAFPTSTLHIPDGIEVRHIDPSSAQA